MGWTEYRANYYKNGTIDRKAECDDLFTWVNHDEEGNEVNRCSVAKSTMVGSTYYAALNYKKANESPEVVGMVCLTRTVEGAFFGYKDMMETCGPNYYDCPLSILNLLTPTESEWANEWREKCRQNNEQQKAKRKHARALHDLPDGSVISFLCPAGMKTHEEGEPVCLTKRYYGRKYPKWIEGKYYWQPGLIPEDYKVIRTGWPEQKEVV